MIKKISLVVPTYNSSSYILDALEYPLEEDRISEIIISDDASKDYAELVNKLQNLSSKIKIYKNNKNLGAFTNKIKAVSYCKNDWAILLDSDNFFNNKFIDRIFQLQPWDSKIIYCPDFARPKFNFQEFSGLTISSNNIANHINQNKLYFNALLNTGNYLVNVNKYQSLRFNQNYQGLVHAADVMFFNYHWLKAGGVLYVAPDLEYNHRIGHNSYYVRKAVASRVLVSAIQKSLNEHEGLPSALILKLKIFFADLNNILFRIKSLIKKILKQNIIIRLIKYSLKRAIFYKDFLKYKQMSSSKIKLSDLRPILNDNKRKTHFDSHYFYQGVWAMDKIKETNVKVHVDIGSDVRWVGLLSTIKPVKFVDIRPFETDLSNLTITEGNILDLPFEDNSIKSLSCMHVAEHIGLGRYGDELNPKGTIQACKELTRVLAKDGSLYFSVPVGRERICFNAHRIFAPETVIEYFSDLKLVELSGITDRGNYLKNIDIKHLKEASYACGLFEFKK